MDRVPCLLFTDDCLLFYKANQTNYRKLKSILDIFGNESGQLVNCHKSTLTFSKNAMSVHKQLVAGIFNISHSESLGKYLGCVMFQQRPNRNTFQELINKAEAKLESWEANC